jgi:prepilin-type N-terminal cleavage/methylation domain-containing protein
MLPQIASRRARRPSPSAGFTLVELLVVMAILTVLAASLVVVIPKLRTGAMIKRARADIEGISTALTMYREDTGFYPVAPYKTTDINYEPEPADAVLYKALVERNAGGPNHGWGGASESWAFLSTKNIHSYADKYGRSQKQIRDPWNVPYYYIPAANYLIGVTIYDLDDDTVKLGRDIPNCFGTTPVPDDYRASEGDHQQPEKAPAPPISAFYNSTTFQIHSKGPNQLTDVDDNTPEIDACDRGTDADDINNWTAR